ncbi:hypothetical protein EJB05_07460 [Eragrostis curvula]|uniref:Phytosulfokine n=1 Tax=Eragrostis curvula TaxID=38414 RepID=A0A5J9WIT8_9POAL|nr:hypothetical protein EJB05_07460 [Eragrostis curvula]
MAMASSSKKPQATLFLAAVLLFLICTRGLAARPVPGSNGHMSQTAVPTSAQEKSGSGPGMEIGHDEPEAMRECEGGEEQDECLMRRTLVAHTDYIYTQGNHN